MADWQDANRKVTGEYINAYKNWGPNDSPYDQYRYTANHKDHSAGDNIWIYLLSTESQTDSSVVDYWNETIGIELNRPAHVDVKYNIMTGIDWNSAEDEPDCIPLPSYLEPLTMY
jgi:hypothetical protein